MAADSSFPPGRRRVRSSGAGLLAGCLLGSILVGVSTYQALNSRRNLPHKILSGGRVVLSSSAFIFHASDPHRNGDPGHLLDGRPDTAAILAFPGPPPEGTYLLSDLALTHFPGPQGSPSARLPRRRPLRLRIFNGICADCQEREFLRYGRIRRARVEILQRRANDPDVEFLIPPARVLSVLEVDFPDRPGPIDIPLDLPDPGISPGYPANVFYIICKVSVLEVYPGEVFEDRVAVAELEYVDSDLEAALQGTPRPFVWK